MGKLIAFEASRIWKRVLFFLAYLVFFVAVTYFSYNNSQLYTGVFISFLASALSLGILNFIFFSFFSYDYFSELNNVEAEEMILSIPRAHLKTIVNQVLIISFLIIIAGIPPLISVNSVLKACDFPSNKYFLHSLLALFRYSVLPSFLGMFLGLALRKRARALAYIVISLFALIGSGYLAGLAENLSIANVELASILDCFQIGVPDLRFAPDGVYGIPLEFSRIIIILFWICLFILISLLSINFANKRLRKILTSAFAALAFILFVFFALRGNYSVKYTGDRPSSYINNPQKSYYLENYENIKSIEKEFEASANEFKVEKYNINIRAGVNLKAEVSTKIDNSNLSSYLFSLDHSYKINKITDGEGNKIPFSRLYDYVIIEPEKKIDEINFSYEGSSQDKYFVNQQNMTLPAYHFYYPRAGFYNIWDYDFENYKINTEFNESDYLVNVQANYDVESNLGKINEYTFQGRAEAVSLFGGFVENHSDDGQRYVYGPMSGIRPYFDINKAGAISKKINNITGFNLAEDYSDKDIFMTHIILKQSNSAEEFSVFSDHIILSGIQPNPETIFYDYVMKELDKYKVKSNFKDIFVKKLVSDNQTEPHEKPNYESLEIIKEYEKLLEKSYFDLSEEEQRFYDEKGAEYFVALDSFYELLDYQINKLGEEYVLKNMYEFIINEDNSVSYVDFIYNMQ